MPRRHFTPPCGFDISHSTVRDRDISDIAFWGYRLVVHPNGTHFIHETYYDAREGILGVALTPARPCGDTPAEVREGWEPMLEAFAEPPLRYAAFTSPGTAYGRYADEPFGGDGHTGTPELGGEG